MLDFNKLLEMVGLDPTETLIVRHAPVEKSLRQILPPLVIERPDLWLAYQRIQWSSLEKAMTRAKHIASFIGMESSSAIFAGIYRIDGWEVLDAEGYRTFPGNKELEELGMSGRDADMPDCLAFNLELLDHYAEWSGRLSITWPKPYQNWWRWGGRAEFPVIAIETESRFVRSMPHWKDLVLGWRELGSLPQSWKARLGQWRGIYLIYDCARQAGYVGSACGADNILGRWSDYSRSGHGGNRELRASNPADLRFSILELTSPELDVPDLLALEASWKERLHTREFGLNRN
ncbi:MAG: GIY-YIG nuclease family protein [Candidatus Andeanibacterium colombiense]|uniref:GIY-YIG nuclease family protein n=1 Tax=Candidatus Andeanibacterium colombiense TaxID=3121345 RepID=A0AAJ6BM90_9SPHN|nr:MAG: GIY-YIG nuclease family protein [Sphingomonadaceae bacterium]